jgi:hypothetical protein
MSSAQEHFEASRCFQEYYDETLRRAGTRAPQPTLVSVSTIIVEKLCGH